MLDIITWTSVELEYVLTEASGERAQGVLDGARDVIFTLTQGGARIEKSGSQIGLEPSESTVRVYLTQEDTGKLQGGVKGKPKYADTQLNIIYDGSARDATYEVQVAVLRNLHPRKETA